MTDELIFTEEQHRYVAGGRVYKSVTQVIKEAGFGPDFSRVDPGVLEAASKRGRYVDDALVYHYEGDLNMVSLHPIVRGYFEGALKFDRECPGKIVAIHPRLYSAELGVAGTPDIVRFVRWHRAVIDWKTGVDNPLQTALYFRLWNLTFPRTPVFERYGLKLNRDGTYKLKQHTDLDDDAAAMSILTGNQKEIERWRPKYAKAN